MSTDAAGAVDAPPTAEAEPTDPGGSPDRGGDRLSAWLGPLTGPRVLQAGALLIVLQLVLRGWVAWGGYFWMDDLIAEGRATRIPLLSSEFLLHNHDGHFMPAGFLVAGLVTKLAPLQWWPIVIGLVLMQAIAAFAVLRLLRLLLGDRPLILFPLALYLFSPLTLPAYSWWMAALNALPLQAGMAWVVGDAVLLLRTGRWRYAVSGSVVFAVTLSFFEKSVVVPVVAFAVAVLLRRLAGDSAPIVSALRMGRWLWIGLATVTGVWGLVYSHVVGSPAIGPDGAGSVPQAVALVRNGIFRGLFPALVGGPLTWAEGGLWADPPTTVTLFALAVVVLAVVWTSRTRRGVGVVWWMVAGYVAASAAAMVAGRLTVMTADVLSLSLRYFTDSIVVVIIAIAIIALSPVRDDLPQQSVFTPSGRRIVATGAAVAFLVACGWSTVVYGRGWEEASTRDYLTTAEASLAETADVPMLDQTVPENVMWLLASPYNLASWVFAPLENRPEFSRTTPRLRMLDDEGHLVDGRVEPLRSIKPGPFEGCGYAVSATRAATVDLDGPVVPWEWTVQLNYLSGGDGTLEIALDGKSVRAPIEKGPHSVYVRVVGGGEKLTLRMRTSGVILCLDSGRVGLVQPETN